MAQTTLRDYLQTTEDAINSGEIEQALTNCQHLLTYFPELLEAQRLLGEVYLAQERLDEAQYAFDWVLTHDPENVVTYCSRALVSERKTEYDTALDCYQQAYELSRGNGQIRQEFNILSAKVGQQGFIFSRAGLARLYMRGDLLSQAIQEWETVLAITPDRLDARTGLLETYWREGSYDGVERLAKEILDDVPGCLKALLLLAHVTFAQDALQAQELMKRVADLDPDLVLAQELFSDFMVNHPKDPFLALLKKDLTLLPEQANGHFSSQEGIPVETGTGSSSPSHPSIASDLLMRWSSLDNIIEPQPDYQIASSLLATPGSNGPSEVGLWGNAVPQERATPPVEELPTQIIHTAGESRPPAFDEEQTLNPVEQEHEPATPPQMAEYDIWNSFDQPPVSPQEEPTQIVQAGSRQEEPFDSWSVFVEEDETLSHRTEAPLAAAGGHISPEANVDVWSAIPAMEVEDTEVSWQVGSQAGASPAWLDMLASSEQHQLSGDLLEQISPPSILSATPEVQEAGDVMISPSALPAREPAAQATTKQEEGTPQPQLAADDEEAFSFGPEWLKSLGATVMNGSPSAEEAVLPEVQLAQPPASGEEPIGATYAAYEAEDDRAMSSFTVEEPMFDWTAALTAEPSAAETQASTDKAHSTETEAVRTPSVESEALQTLAASAASDGGENAPEPATPTMLSVTSELAEQSIQPTRQVSFEHWLDQAAHRLTQSDQDVQTTLEELEKDLRSQGFMPLEPGALSTIAQQRQEPDLSSALASFGNSAEQPLKQEQRLNQPDESLSTAQAERGRDEPKAEPLWPATASSSLQAAESVPLPATRKAREMPAASASHLDALSNYVSRPASPSQQRARSEPARVEAPASLSASSVPEPASYIPPAPPAAPAQPPMPVDIELETTMKRPTPRLQKQRPVSPPVPPKGGNGSRSTGGKTPEEKSGYQERLLKGYQYQLAGAYDEAMQEYRQIIRNAPDLLSEVISNMRALLKLAPKYAAGYRVLGDAYMRQGEYLQAMEAYNKALTMAKKAKG